MFQKIRRSKTGRVVWARSRLERGPDSEVFDGQWFVGEAVDPHRSHALPGIQVGGGFLCI